MNLRRAAVLLVLFHVSCRGMAGLELHNLLEVGMSESSVTHVMNLNASCRIKRLVGVAQPDVEAEGFPSHVAERLLQQAHSAGGVPHHAVIYKRHWALVGHDVFAVMYDADDRLLAHAVSHYN